MPMAMNPRRLVLVCCRHCLQPIMLVGAAADVELASLRDHLRDCVPGQPLAHQPDADGVLRHFRLVGDDG